MAGIARAGDTVYQVCLEVPIHKFVIVPQVVKEFYVIPNRSIKNIRIGGQVR